MAAGGTGEIGRDGPRRSKRARTSKSYQETGSSSSPEPSSASECESGADEPFPAKTVVAARLSPADSRRAAAQPDAVRGDILYEALGGKGSVKTLADGWLEAYESDSEQALLQLINLVLRTAETEDGRPLTLRDLVASKDDIPARLHALQEALAPKETVPVLSQTRGRHVKVFRRRFAELLRTIGQKVVPLLPAEWINEAMVPWMASLSSVAYRPLRLAASLAVLSLLAGVAGACAACQREIGKLNRLGRKDALDDRSGCLASLENLMQTLLDSVFVQRFRDVEASIRASAIECLTECIRVYPPVFLDNAYLRYLGWALSDRAATVRLGACSSLLQLYGEDEMVGSLAAFTERFKPRLLQMARGDIDQHARLAAIGVVGALLACGTFVSSQETRELAVLLDEEPKIRRAAGTLIACACFGEPTVELARSRCKDAGSSEAQLVACMMAFVAEHMRDAKHALQLCGRLFELFVDDLPTLKDIGALLALEGEGCLGMQLGLVHSAVAHRLKTAEKEEHAGERTRIARLLSTSLPGLLEDVRRVSDVEVLGYASLLATIHWPDVLALESRQAAEALLDTALMLFRSSASEDAAVDMARTVFGDIPRLARDLEPALQAARSRLLEGRLETLFGSHEGSVAVQLYALGTTGGLQLSVGQIDRLTSLHDETRVEPEDGPKVAGLIIRTFFQEMLWALLADAQSSTALVLRTKLVVLCDPRVLKRTEDRLLVEGALRVFGDLCALLGDQTRFASLRLDLFSDETAAALFEVVVVAVQGAIASEESAETPIVSACKVVSSGLVPVKNAAHLLQFYGLADCDRHLAALFDQRVRREPLSVLFSLAAESLRASFALAGDGNMDAATVPLMRMFLAHFRLAVVTQRNDDAVLAFHQAARQLHGQKPSASTSRFLARVVAPFAVFLPPSSAAALASQVREDLRSYGHPGVVVYLGAVQKMAAKSSGRRVERAVRGRQPSPLGRKSKLAQSVGDSEGDGEAVPSSPLKARRGDDDSVFDGGLPAEEQVASGAEDGENAPPLRPMRTLRL